MMAIDMLHSIDDLIESYRRNPDQAGRILRDDAGEWMDTINNSIKRMPKRHYFVFSFPRSETDEMAEREVLASLIVYYEQKRWDVHIDGEPKAYRVQLSKLRAN